MQAIIATMLALESRIRQYQADEDRGDESVHGLKCRLMGYRDGIQYALNAQGLEFAFTDCECKAGTIRPYSYGVRGKLFD